MNPRYRYALSMAKSFCVQVVAPVVAAVKEVPRIINKDTNIKIALAVCVTEGSLACKLVLSPPSRVEAPDE